LRFAPRHGNHVCNKRLAAQEFVFVSQQSLPILPKRFLDFATLAVGTTQEVTLADRVELLHWRELTLTVRVHSHTMSFSNFVQINVYPQSWTAEDPGAQFINVSATSVQITSSTPSPGVLVLTIPTLGLNAIGAMARITAFGSKGATQPMQVSMSMEFSAKNA
jgi:hypothetical protein